MKKKKMNYGSVSKILLLAFVFAVAFLIFSASNVKAKDAYTYAIIDCFCDKDHAFVSIGEKYKGHNGLNKDDDIHWLLIGPEGTEVSLTFSVGNGCKGNAPFTDATSPIKQTIVMKTDRKFNFISRTASGEEGCFNYDYSCSNWTAQQSQSAKSDPIIDVPPKP